MTMDVAKVYAEFFRKGGAPPGSEKPWHYRRPETSLRLAGCLTLARLVRARLPERALDLGSGLTSHILRGLMPELSPMMVVTTDTSPGWLGITTLELLRDELNSEHCYVQEDFERQTWEPFHLISVDAGNLDYRVTLASRLASWCAPDGLLVLDDWHMRDYAPRMTKVLTRFGFTVTALPESIDEQGGYLAIAERQ